MTGQDLLHLAGTVLIHWAAAVGLASVAVHLRVFDRTSRLSVHLLLYMMIIDAMLILSCIVNDIGDSSWFQLVRLVVFVGVPLVMTQRLWLQIDAQRIGRRTSESTHSDIPDSLGHPED